jgi:hypothetical protein
MDHGLLTYLPHRHVVATLPSLFDDIDLSGLLEVIQYRFYVFCFFTILSHSLGLLNRNFVRIYFYPKLAYSFFFFSVESSF